MNTNPNDNYPCDNCQEKVNWRKRFWVDGKVFCKKVCLNKYRETRPKRIEEKAELAQYPNIEYNGTACA